MKRFSIGLVHSNEDAQPSVSLRFPYAQKSHAAFVRLSANISPKLHRLAVLWIDDNSLGSSLAQFELSADLLDLRGLLFELACERLYFLLLLRNGSLELVPQLSHFPMLFEKLIQQHCVDLIVANGFGQSRWIATYQVRMHFGHFLRDQTKGKRLRSIVLLVVAKADRVKLIDRFAGCVHGFARMPIAVLSSPLVLAKSARYPFAVLSSPSVLLRSDSSPVAVLTLPVVLLKRAFTPATVLLKPVVLLWSANEPVTVLSSPVVLLESASAPMAVLSLPVVLLPSASPPLAVFRIPVVLSPRTNTPLAVLKLPVVLFARAAAPVAVFWLPVVLLISALKPVAVLKLAVVFPRSAL